MNIELRSIQIQDRQSEETTAFTASLYIERQKVGWAKNSGKGGPTNYGVDNYHDEDVKLLLKEAESYCLSLEPLKLGDGLGSVPMNLELFIDEIVDRYWNDREEKKFKSQLAKHSLTSLCIGNEKEYKRITWPKKNSQWSITELLSTETGRKHIKTTIQNYKRTMSPSDRILNQNIPEDLL